MPAFAVIAVMVLGYVFAYAGVRNCALADTLKGTCVPGSGAPLVPAGSPTSTLPPPGSYPAAPGGGGDPASVFKPPGWPAQSFCGTPPNLVSAGTIKLQKAAMDAYLAANAAMIARIGQRITVVSSYRSCASQTAVCIAHGCMPPNCCPGKAAAVGKSYHQLGLAIDVSNYSAALPFLTGAGWCHPLASSDPGHFSYGGCG